VGFGLVLASLQLLIIQFAVESPRYLWSRGQRVEARHVLRYLRGTANVDDEVAGWVSASDASDSDEVPSRAERTVTIFNIFMFPEYRKPWVLVLLLQFGQQLSGINTVFYYSSSVLEKMFSSHVSSILTMLIGVLNVLATSSGALIVDRFGRRPLLFASMATMTISITLLGLSLAFSWNVMAVASLYLVVASFAPGYGPVPFLLGTEFFDVKAAAAGGSWALAANWTGTFIVAAAFLPVQNIIGQWVFGVFVAALVICGAVFFVHIPETKGKTIEEIAKKL
ncbi:Bifunctional purine biosynthesis protein PurH, partial [Linderina pennispora]